jgi:hypothetical protein
MLSYYNSNPSLGTGRQPPPPLDQRLSPDGPERYSLRYHARQRQVRIFLISSSMIPNHSVITILMLSYYSSNPLLPANHLHRAV